MTTRFEERSHRDYWFLSLDNGATLVVSQDSRTSKVLVSLLATPDGKPDLSPPQEATFDPHALTEGTVLGSESGKEFTITKVTFVPRMAVTGRRIT